MARKLTSNDWDAILLNRAYGMSNTKSAEKLGIGSNSVNAALMAFDAVKEEDWAKCCNLIVTYSLGLEVFNWAAQKTGKSIPQIIPQAYEKYIDDKRKKNLAEIKAKEHVEKSATAPDGGVDQDAIKILMSQLVAEQKKTNELFESLLDVVIPKYVADLKDNINANSDVINQTTKNCADTLDALKLAVRKRGL